MDWNQEFEHWKQEVERQLVPANVLKLIRYDKAANVDELQAVLGFNDIAPNTQKSFFAERLEEILGRLAAANLVSREHEKLIPTESIARIQQALGISLTALSKIAERSELGEMFVDPSVIDELRQCHNKKYDLAKVVRFCEELNSSFASGNYLASILLIRALINHVPPVFGHNAFQQVVSQSGKSVKELLKPLEDISRDVADLHSHALIRHKENLPTKNQVEPFKANVEVLLHEVIAKSQEQA